MDIEDSIAQFEEVFEGNPWFGNPILQSLRDIPVGFWDKKPEKAPHTIAEIVCHIIDWRGFFIEKLKDNEAFGIELNTEKDWRQGVSVHTETQKQEILEELIKTQGSICRLLTKKPDAWMYEQAIGSTYKNEYMVRGVIQHDIYHLGQIHAVYGQLKR